MSAPRLIFPPPASGGVPVGGSGTAGTLPIWVASSTLGNSAVTQVSGSIFSLTGLVGGAGYAATSTAIVALGGGTGTGATAQIVTSGGAVTWVALKDPGQDYTAGDVLTIPGGTGTITVLAIVPKNDASGHLTAQRIGAGTAQPTAGLDSRFGIQVTGSQVKNVEVVSGLTPVTLSAVTSTEFYTSVPFGNFLAGHLVNVATSATGFAAGGLISGYWSYVNCSASAGANSLTIQGTQIIALRSYAADQNTNVGMTGGAFVSQLRNANNYQTTIMRGVSGSVQSFSSATGNVTNRAVAGDFSATFSTPVTVADLRAIEGSITLSGGAVATTIYGQRLPAATITAPSVLPAAYYPHAQEDTLGRNYFRSPTFFGSAVGTARSASLPSVEVEAVAGVSNGDVRLRTAAAVFDASASSTNGTKYFNRGGAGISSTTQLNYEEGTYTPTLTGWVIVNCTGYWTRTGRNVQIWVQFTGGTSSAAGGWTITVPAGLTPARLGAGLTTNANGAVIGSGNCAPTTGGVITGSTAISSTTVDKVIWVSYEV